jgi:pimeloyl-ACP methyl ester carboxylesterase
VHCAPFARPRGVEEDGRVTRRHVRLPDGRRIDYVELGDPAGEPALYLHGTPSSASEALWLHEPARTRGVRLVSPDRPGYLGSEPPPAPSLAACADDVVALADAVELERFGVVGFSGGAAFALAAAHTAGPRATVVHLGGGLGSLADGGWADLPRGRRIGFRLVARAPAIARPLLGGAFALLRRGLRKRLDSPADAARWFFEGPARGAQVEAVEEYVRRTPPEELRQELADFAEGTRALDAVVADVRAIVGRWPFEFATVTTPVEIWHGLDDPAAPAAGARRLAAGLPNVSTHLFEHEGHFVFHSHGDEVAASLAARASTA